MRFDLNVDYVTPYYDTYIVYTHEYVYVIQIYKVCSICELHVFVSPWLWRRITSGIWGNPPDQRPEKI